MSIYTEKTNKRKTYLNNVIYGVIKQMLLIRTESVEPIFLSDLPRAANLWDHR